MHHFWIMNELEQTFANVIGMGVLIILAFTMGLWLLYAVCLRMSCAIIKEPTDFPRCMLYTLITTVGGVGLGLMASMDVVPAPTRTVIEWCIPLVSMVLVLRVLAKIEMIRSLFIAALTHGLVLVVGIGLALALGIGLTMSERPASEPEPATGSSTVPLEPAVNVLDAGIPAALE